MADTEILLESGTNEIEIMQFTINDELYGINVAKVREIMMADKVKPIPHAHNAVEGIFKPREILLTVVDLPKYLTKQECEKHPRDLFIVTNFNKMHIAFRVHRVVGISRISWTDIQKPDNTISHGEEGVATGIAQCGDNLVTILDFEKIVAEIAPETGIQVEEITKMGKRSERQEKIVLAEDSILLTKMIMDSLAKAGNTNVTNFNNGKEAWDYLTTAKKNNTLDESADLIITDIEMPEMDGYTFDRFIVGPSNKFAHAAAIAVSQNPGKAYNPLLIYGNSGLGKTHLLLAIGQTIRHNNPSAKIAYVKGEEFVNQMVKSIGTGTAENFRQKYRNADLLLMDDIQFIAGKDSTQEEFFHTFNCLYEAGKQIVVTSDRPPKEMKRLDDRLCTRLEGGLLADVQPPDLETRTAIIRTKAAQFGMILSEDVVQYIAENITSNVRQLHPGRHPHRHLYPHAGCHY